jgi:diacylglycerol kinase family enzyme
VANGLLQREGSASGEPAIPIGILPGGSGNSVMLDLGCWSLKEAARRIGTCVASYVKKAAVNRMK